MDKNSAQMVPKFVLEVDQLTIDGWGVVTSPSVGSSSVLSGDSAPSLTKDTVDREFRGCSEGNKQKGKNETEDEKLPPMHPVETVSIAFDDDCSDFRKTIEGQLNRMEMVEKGWKRENADLRKEIEEKENSVASLKISNEALKKEKEESDANIRSLKEKVSRLEEQRASALADYVTAIRAMYNWLHEEQQKVNDASDTIKTLRESLKETNAELATLKSTSENLQNRLEKETKERLRENIDHMRKLKRKDEELTEITKLKDILQGQLDEEKLKVEELQCSKRSLLATLKDEKKDRSKEKEELDHIIEDFQTNAAEERMARDREVNKNKAIIETLQMDLKEEKKKATDAFENIQQLQAELEKDSAEIISLKQQVMEQQNNLETEKNERLSDQSAHIKELEKKEREKDAFRRLTEILHYDLEKRKAEMEKFEQEMKKKEEDASSSSSETSHSPNAEELSTGRKRASTDDLEKTTSKKGREGGEK